VVAISEATFHDLVTQVPGFALEVMRAMARRLRQSNAGP
jgi:CRP-like cAMP-binding protein